MLCFALLCVALLRFALLCFTLLMLCFVSRCLALQFVLLCCCFALLCVAVLCFALLCCWCYIALVCFALLIGVALFCFVLLCFALLCCWCSFALPCFVLLCFATGVALRCFALLCFDVFCLLHFAIGVTLLYFWNCLELLRIDWSCLELLGDAFWKILRPTHLCCSRKDPGVWVFALEEIQARLHRLLTGHAAVAPTQKLWQASCLKGAEEEGVRRSADNCSAFCVLRSAVCIRRPAPHAHLLVDASEKN